MTTPATVMQVYNRLDVVFDHGQGVWLFDDQGRRYLDFCSGIAVSALGHAHPRLVETLAAQGAKLWHTSNLYRVKGQETLSQKLVDSTFADTVFFTNSGVEAWECGVKTVRRHFYAKGQPEKFRLIVIEGAFHGRTLGAISATRSEKMIGGMGPLLDGFDPVAFDNMNELRQAITPATAAIHIEPIMGEGGVKVADASYLRALREVADEFGLLLYFDEIQCGMGRTGKLFAHEWSGVTPDVMCVAKGIGGGFPLGACLATADAASGMTAGYHGSTYGGNPLAMAIGEAVLDTMLEPEFLPHVAQAGAALKHGLEELSTRHPGLILEIRGMGLMLGIRLADAVDPTSFVNAALANGLLVARASDNVVRILPPLIVSEAEIETGLDLLDRTCAGLVPA